MNRAAAALALLVLAAAALAGCVPNAAPALKAPEPAAAATPAPTSAAYLATAPNLTKLAAAAKVAGLIETLAGPGPFTVFAPTDAAFDRLAPATSDALLQPENRDMLSKFLAFHVVAGTFTLADLVARVGAGSGTAMLTSVEGESLTLTLTEGHLTLTDSGGNRSYVETGDVRRSNGIVHIVNGVLVPRLG